MRLLVLNSGSSSVKYRLFDLSGPRAIASGEAERIGERGGRFLHRVPGERSAAREESRDFPDHGAALAHIFTTLEAPPLAAGPATLAGIGHRVVHGGETFRAPALVNEAVIQAIRDTVPLAPLHNPANLLGIEVAREQCPELPQVVVFDTAFHQTLPPVAYHYAIPHRYYTEDGIRRYGFHGTSHAYVAREAARLLERPPETLNLITLHLGNGASVAALRAGRSVDTSMGMTPLEGLVMGTRSGDLDPSIVPHLQRTRGMSAAEVDAMLNEDSGLKGIAGRNDMRELHRAAEGGDARARLAIEVFCYRVKKYIGAYLAVLGRVDAIVFTGGIGEHDAAVRSESCAGLDALGIRVDARRNAASADGPRAIHAAGSPVHVLVVPTDEELEIARQAAECIEGAA